MLLKLFLDTEPKLAHAC